MADVAMDLHKRHSEVATLDRWGELQELRIEHDGDSGAMEKFLSGLEVGSRIAIEATASWWWVVDLAEKHGHEVVLSNPKKTRLIADACLKNDRVDTDQLLHLLRLGYLPRVWIPPAPLRYGKELLRYRALLVSMRTRLKLSECDLSQTCPTRDEATKCVKMANVSVWKFVRPRGGQVVQKHRLIDPASKSVNHQAGWLSPPGRGGAGAIRAGSCSPFEGLSSVSSAVCARCHAASRSRRSSATIALAVSWIASA